MKNKGYASLNPNSVYTGPNDAEYETDQYGRIRNWSGKTSSEAQPRNLYAQRTLEGKNEEQTDAGHLIASNQGGSGEKYNMVPMNDKVNRRDYRAWERENEALKEEGYDVQLNGSLAYTTGKDTNNPEAIMANRDVYKDGQYLYTEHFSITNYDLDDLENVGEREAFELASEYDNPVQNYYDETTDTVYDVSSDHSKNSFNLNDMTVSSQEETESTKETSDSTVVSDTGGNESAVDDEDGLSL